MKKWTAMETTLEKTKQKQGNRKISKLAEMNRRRSSPSRCDGVNDKSYVKDYLLGY